MTSIHRFKDPELGEINYTAEFYPIRGKFELTVWSKVPKKYRAYHRDINTGEYNINGAGSSWPAFRIDFTLPEDMFIGYNEETKLYDKTLGAETLEPFVVGLIKWHYENNLVPTWGLELVDGC